MIDKSSCDKGFIWVLSNCECEYGKSCDIGEHLDYENCKFGKKLVDELVEECTETEDEVKMAKITLAEYEDKYSSCTLYIVLLSIIFIINIGIGNYLIYSEYIYHETVTKKGFIYQRAI